MNSFFEESMFAGVTLSIIAYLIGAILKKKFKLGIFNPLLIAIVVSIVFLAVGNIDYEVYNEGAKFLSWLLTPATVCLAIPLYEQWDLLKHNHKAVLLGLTAGVVTSLVTVLVLSLLLGLSHEEYVTITVAVIIVTGVLGNMFGELICKVFKIEEPISKGLAFGSAAHAIGTAKAMEIGEIEGAMSSLAIAVSGILTVILSSVFAHFL